MSDLLNRKDEIWHRRALKQHFEALQESTSSNDRLRVRPLPPADSLKFGELSAEHPSLLQERFIYPSLQAGLHAIDEFGILDEPEQTFSGFQVLGSGGRWCFYRGVPTLEGLGELIAEGSVDFMAIYLPWRGEEYLLDYVVDDPLDGTVFEVERQQLSPELAEFLAEI